MPETRSRHHWLKCAFMALALSAIVDRESTAGEADAAALAALIDRHIETRLEAEARRQYQGRDL